MDTLPICEAKSKQSGLRCKNFATKGKHVCRIHGGKSTGAKTPEGKHRQKMASWKHGRESKESIENLRAVNAAIKTLTQFIRSV